MALAVPARVRPKSPRSASSTSTLAGLTSRCTSPAACAAPNPSTTSRGSATAHRAPTVRLRGNAVNVNPATSCMQSTAPSPSRRRCRPGRRWVLPCVRGRGCLRLDSPLRVLPSRASPRAPQSRPRAARRRTAQSGRGGLRSIWVFFRAFASEARTRAGPALRHTTHEQGHNRVDLELLRRVTLTDKTKVFKTSLLTRRPGRRRGRGARPRVRRPSAAVKTGSAWRPSP